MPPQGLSLIVSLAVAAILVASCGQGDSALYADRTTVASAPTPTLGPSAAYLGRWAANPEACTSQGWEFAADRLQSPAGSWCEISQPRPSPAGYSFVSLCHGDSAARPGRLLATFSDVSHADSMTVEGGPFDGPVPLVRCRGAG